MSKARRLVKQAAADVSNMATAYRDGVAIGIEIDFGQLASDIRLALAGQLKGKVMLPARLLIDPSYVAEEEA